MTFTYQWRRCNTKGASCANIIGATKKTYEASSVDVGNTLRVRVRAANATGSSAAVSAPTDVVAPKKSITLDSNQSTAVYGRTVLLTGALRNGRAGESVTITELRTPAVGGIRTQALATVKTDADGKFSLRVRPAVQTQYTATSGDAKSSVVPVRVRSLVRLKHIGPNRFLVAGAGRALVRREVGVAPALEQAQACLGRRQAGLLPQRRRGGLADGDVARGLPHAARGEDPRRRPASRGEARLPRGLQQLRQGLT
jgi:hypothetical protein